MASVGVLFGKIFEEIVHTVVVTEELRADSGKHRCVCVCAWDVTCDVTCGVHTWCAWDVTCGVHTYILISCMSCHSISLCHVICHVMSCHVRACHVIAYHHVMP